MSSVPDADLRRILRSIKKQNHTSSTQNDQVTNFPSNRSTNKKVTKSKLATRQPSDDDEDYNTNEDDKDYDGNDDQDADDQDDDEDDDDDNKNNYHPLSLYNKADSSIQTHPLLIKINNNEKNLNNKNNNSNNNNSSDQDNITDNDFNESFKVQRKLPKNKKKENPPLKQHQGRESGGEERINYTKNYSEGHHSSSSVEIHQKHRYHHHNQNKPTTEVSSITSNGRPNSYTDFTTKKNLHNDLNSSWNGSSNDYDSNFNSNNITSIDDDCNNNNRNINDVSKRYQRWNKAFYNGFMNKQDKSATMPEYQQHASELLHFLKSLWKNNTMCDLSISIGRHKFWAHRLGLAMFSRKYRDEFQRQLQNNIGNFKGFILKKEENTFFKLFLLLNKGIYTISLVHSSRTGLEAILNYIYTAKIDINPANVEEISIAAKELAIDDLIRMTNDYLCSLSIGDILDFMGNIFSNDGSALMFHELYSYMMNHLEKVTRTPEYLRSSLDVVRGLIGDSHLNVTNEIQVFDAIIRWFEFDKKNRITYLAEALKLVRFTFISPDKIATKVER
jgi:hypothetical protein